MIRIFTNTAMCEDGDTYMVSGGQGAVWSANSSTSILQSLKSLLLLVSTLIGIPHRERRSGANIQEKSPRGPSVCLDAAKKKKSAVVAANRSTVQDIPIYSKIVPSSFSSTMWFDRTLSYRVCGFLSGPGIVVTGLREQKKIGG